MDHNLDNQPYKDYVPVFPTDYQQVSGAERIAPPLWQTREPCCSADVCWWQVGNAGISAGSHVDAGEMGVSQN